MIFQKRPTINLDSKQQDALPAAEMTQADEVETVVGPSVHVEGDLSSAGDILVKGSVTGSIHTTKHLTVEPGAKIVANVRAGSAKVAGEVRGDVKIKDFLEFTSTARVLGDIAVKTLTMESGAVIFGKITMPGIEANEKTMVGKKILRKNGETESLVV